MSKKNVNLSINYLYKRAHFWEWRDHERLNVSMKIVFDTKTNDLMHDRVLFLMVIIIIQRMSWNIPYQYSNNTSLCQIFGAKKFL